MIERIIEIAETAAHLSLENQCLKLQCSDKQTTSIPIREIQCVILANPAITITGALLAALSSAGVIVVVSGDNRLPVSMQLPLDGNYIQNERFRAQISASQPLQKRLWQCIVKQKIYYQGLLLKELHGSDHNLLKLYKTVSSGDKENLEARAAAIYWKKIFEKPFVRCRDCNDNNLLLNYGYAILRAMSARACCSAGLHPTLGINHHNRYNPYCLADDLMEPYRFIVDKKVAEMNPENFPVIHLTKDIRYSLLEALLKKVKTSSGYWAVSELLKISASQIADSFVSKDVRLTYE